jgi:hypothetical protein
VVPLFCDNPKIKKQLLRIQKSTMEDIGIFLSKSVDAHRFVLATKVKAAYEHRHTLTPSERGFATEDVIGLLDENRRVLRHCGSRLFDFTMNQQNRQDLYATDLVLFDAVSNELLQRIQVRDCKYPLDWPAVGALLAELWSAKNDGCVVPKIFTILAATGFTARVRDYAPILFHQLFPNHELRLVRFDRPACWKKAYIVSCDLLKLTAQREIAEVRCAIKPRWYVADVFAIITRFFASTVAVNLDNENACFADLEKVAFHLDLSMGLGKTIATCDIIKRQLACDPGFRVVICAEHRSSRSQWVDALKMVGIGMDMVVDITGNSVASGVDTSKPILLLDQDNVPCDPPAALLNYSAVFVDETSRQHTQGKTMVKERLGTQHDSRTHLVRFITKQRPATKLVCLSGTPKHGLPRDSPQVCTITTAEGITHGTNVELNFSIIEASFDESLRLLQAAHHVSKETRSGIYRVSTTQRCLEMQALLTKLNPALTVLVYTGQTDELTALLQQGKTVNLRFLFFGNYLLFLFLGHIYTHMLGCTRGSGDCDM